MNVLPVWQTVLFATGVVASAAAQQPSDPHRFLNGYVDLQVADEGGGTASESKRLIKPVDVNGAVRLRFRRDTLSQYGPASPTAMGDTAMRRLTLALLADLETYTRVAESLARSVMLGDSAFRDASNRAGAWYSDYTKHVIEYFTLRVQREVPDSNPERAANKLARQYAPTPRMPAFVKLLQQDLQRLLREAAATNPDYGTLRIAALRITTNGDTVQVKVPGYDTTAEQSPTVIRKITTEMTPQEQAANQYARDASTKVKNIGDLAAYSFSSYVQLVADARSSARDLVDALHAAADSLRASRGRSFIIGVVPPEASEAANRVAAGVPRILEWLDRLVTTSRGLQVAIQAALDTPQDPMAWLAALSQAFEAAKEAESGLIRGRALADTINAHLTALVAKAPSLDVLAKNAVATAPLNRIVLAYGRLEGVVRSAKTLVSVGGSLPQLAAAFTDEQIRRLKLVPQPVTTAPESQILMARAGGDRAEGDVLVVHAELASPTGERLASHEWYFTIEKLGWSSRFAAGIGFERSTAAASDEPMRPIPVLAWVLRNRKRGDSVGQRRWNFVDPSFGIHTVTLSSAQGVQIGVGLSLNLLSDFLQVGVGRNLQPVDDNDRYYWYFGLGLFKLVGLGK